MHNEIQHLSRRELVKQAGITIAGAVVGAGNAGAQSPTDSNRE
jgi:hypothetical protein